MLKNKSAGKDTRKRIMKAADSAASERLSENAVGELSRLGAVWSGILDLEDPIPASEVAAMLSAHALIRGTMLVDADPHWTDAATFAVLAACSEPRVELFDQDFAEEVEEKKNFPMGFSRPEPDSQE
jgi:hypothetical protein